MHGLPLRKPAPLRRISGRRAVVVVLLLAAGFLLAMPSAADAHIVKAHRAQYAAMLKGWVTTHSQLEQYFDGCSSSLNAMSNAISQLLGSQDPNDQAALQTLEKSAQEAATTISQAAGNVQNKVEKTFDAAELRFGSRGLVPRRPRPSTTSSSSGRARWTCTSRTIGTP